MARHNDVQQSHRRVLCVGRGGVSDVGGGRSEGGGEDGGWRDVEGGFVGEVWDVEVGGGGALNE